MVYAGKLLKKKLLSLVIATLLLLGLIAMVVIGLWIMHGREKALTFQAEHNMARVLEEHLRATVVKADIVLQQAVRETSPLLAQRFDRRMVDHRLTELLKMLPESRSLRVMDVTGTLVYDAEGGSSPGRIADRAYFIRHLTDPNAGLVISEPIFSHATRNWVITLSRRLNDQRGNFIGLVQTTIDADYFSQFYKTFDDGEGAIALYDLQSRLIARHPFVSEQMGKPLYQSPIGEAILSGQMHGDIVFNSTLDGVKRLYVYQRVRGLPFYVVVGQSETTVYRSWYMYAWGAAAGVILLTLALMFMVYQWLQTYRNAVRMAENMQALAMTKDSHVQALLDGLPDLAWICDLDGRFQVANHAFARFIGRRQDQIQGQLLKEIWPPHVVAMFEQYDQSAMLQGQVYKTELMLKDEMDDLRTFLYVRVPVKDVKGQLIGTAGVAHDITALKQVEYQLREQQKVLQQFIDNSPGLICMLDMEGNFLLANRACEKVFGYADGSLIGRAYEDLPTSFKDEISWHDLRLAIATGKPLNLELKLLVAEEKRTYLMLSFPVLSPDGDVIAIGCIATNITERIEAEQRLLLLASVFEHAHDAIAITDSKSRILEVNPAFTLITGYQKSDVIGHSPNILQSGRHGPDFYQKMWEQLTQNSFWHGEIWNRRKTGEVYPELLTITTVKDNEGAAKNYIAVFSDISLLKEQQKRLEHLANFDALTQLPNRVMLAARLDSAMMHAVSKGKLLAVCFLDLDGFKPINDTHGHECGDRLLVEMANRFRATLRETDTVARLGGDEFVLLLTGLNAAAECEHTLDRILEAVARPLWVQGRSLSVSASIGVALFPHDDVDGDTLLRHADLAMYQAKQAGRSRYTFFDSVLDRKERTRRSRLERIQHGLAHGEFIMYYQPKVDMRDHTVVGLEALIRWNHPEWGVLLPGRFLPDVEGTELAIPLGEWVIETVLTQLDHWHARNLELPVSINIAAEHLQQTDFVAQLTKVLSRHPLVPGRLLELEVLETTALNDISRVSEIMQACEAALGVTFALDDFGTGYSSLTYFKRLPAATMKIDQSFVRDMLQDPEDLAIVQGLIGLTKAFHREVIAEGVETNEHAQLLISLGCYLGQGYGIAKPMPADQVEAWVASYNAANPDVHTVSNL
ncbi:bifunctional diguanylate cyclase/phosphodiesterase [Leeia oryzae]|uniref:bifunctional diguanylate cyclase/phosphodiesterase n=1 Tax=Leeia oryzae TaxID=356662 RepID=UPI001461473B|nr:EAL domain-containing protein [Leeia oryzae]